MSDLEEGFKPLKRKKKDENNNNELVHREKKFKTFAVKIDQDIIDKVNDYGFWEGRSQAEIAEEALKEFFDKREVKPMPEPVRKKMEDQAKRRRRGRKM
jgi:broad specificity phosphatase PhoE